MASLEERLQRLEDQIAIYQTVCGYGYAVDGCNADALGEIYAEDGVYAVADTGGFNGRAAVQAITKEPTHLELVGRGAAHVSTLPYVVIDGDKAVATCHTLVARNTDDGFSIWRLSASRIHLERRPEGGWHIKHRQNYLLKDDPRGSALLGRLMEGPAPA
jgi:ketosteroid isomerase-like protein